MNILQGAIIAGVLFFFFNLPNVNGHLKSVMDKTAQGSYLMAFFKPLLFFIVFYLVMQVFTSQERFYFQERFTPQENYSCESPVDQCQNCI